MVIIKTRCILNTFFKLCQYFEWFDILDQNCISEKKINYTLLLHLFIIHNMKYNELLDDRNLILLKKCIVGESINKDNLFNLFNLCNNNHRLWNYLINVIKLNKGNSGIEQYGKGNILVILKQVMKTNSSPKAGGIIEFIKQHQEIITYKGCDFFLPFQLLTPIQEDEILSKYINSYFTYSCYQYCKTFELNPIVEKSTMADMINYFKETGIEIWTKDCANTIQCEDIKTRVRTLFNFNPKLVLEYENSHHLNFDNVIRLKGIDNTEEFCKLLYNMGLSYYLIKLNKVPGLKKNINSTINNLKMNPQEEIYFRKIFESNLY